MEMQVINTTNGQAGTCQLADSIFAVKYNEPLVHQILTAYAARARQGTKAQKTRAQVRGGGAKPWRQKGSGRARAGTSRGPIWRTGGVTFAAQPRDYTQKVNKKMYRAAIRSIFSELVRQSRLVLIDKIELESPKTKELSGVLKSMDMADVLIVSDQVDENLYLSARNIPYVDVRDTQQLDPMSLVAYDKVMMTVEAVKQVEEQLA